MAVTAAAKAHLEKLASQPVPKKPKKATKKATEETNQWQSTNQADK